MKFVIDRNKLGLAEEIYGLRIIKQHKNHRNLLMYPVAGVWGKDRSIKMSESVTRRI